MRKVSTGYALAYRLGFTPWERYGEEAAASIGALLDREETARSHPPGRALDLGCGRGQKTHELARRGWAAVGIDNVPRAIEAANRTGTSGATFVVGDVTDLASADLGTFDFFLDAG
jgi:2-polyprenyl-3-methyl-5-hydroxy-6-metoxy-1,4-benzoquinol methylase